MMTTEQFEMLRNIFSVARNEAKNDEKLGDWLLDVAGTLIAMGVELMNREDGKE